MPSIRRHIAAAATAASAALALLAPGTLRAQPATAQPLWEVGAFASGASQQAYPGSDQQVQRGLALPYVVEFGPGLKWNLGEGPGGGRACVGAGIIDRIGLLRHWRRARPAGRHPGQGHRGALT